MFPSALGVSTFAAEAQSPFDVGKAKGPDHSGPFNSSRVEENQLHTKLPTQTLKTNQSTAQQHKRHTTVGNNRWS